MAKTKLRPLDDRVVVQPVEAEERTAGGIVLPDAAREKPQRGKVVAVGAGKLLDNGQRGQLSVAIGDEVIYGKYGGTDIELNGDEVKILRESDILAKVVAVGAGKLLDNGQRGQLSVAVGDEVIYGKYGGTDIELNGDEVKILRESDILAKVVG